jgi:hypothetical protein
MADTNSTALLTPANPPLTVTLTLARNARLVVEPDMESGLVLIHLEGDRHSGATLQAEAALDLAMRLVGCVARSFRAQS